jgi:hypothetical protein
LNIHWKWLFWGYVQDQASGGGCSLSFKFTDGICLTCKRLTYMTSAKVKVEHSEPSLCYANYINQHREVRLNNRHIEMKYHTLRIPV